MNSRVINITRVTSANENASLCAPCGGKCCSNMPGAFLPSDLANENDPEAVWARVQQLLATGRYAIDRLKGRDMPSYPEWSDEFLYYLRPAVAGSEGKLFDSSFGGKCNFHQVNGCELQEEARPAQCKLLTPAADSKCSYPAEWKGLQAVARAWEPYYPRFESLW
jgi:hypothetical protein